MQAMLWARVKMAVAALSVAACAGGAIQGRGRGPPWPQAAPRQQRCTRSSISRHTSSFSALRYAAFLPASAGFVAGGALPSTFLSNAYTPRSMRSKVKLSRPSTGKEDEMGR